MPRKGENLLTVKVRRGIRKKEKATMLFGKTWIVSLECGQIEYTGASCPSNTCCFWPVIASQTYNSYKRLLKSLITIKPTKERQILPTYLNHLVITACNHRQTLIWMGKCNVIYTTNMSIKLWTDIFSPVRSVMLA